jgi:hypothetical protein
MCNGGLGLASQLSEPSKTPTNQPDTPAGIFYRSNNLRSRNHHPTPIEPHHNQQQARKKYNKMVCIIVQLLSTPGLRLTQTGKKQRKGSIDAFPIPRTAGSGLGYH